MSRFLFKLNIFNISKKIFNKKKTFMNKFKPTILLENKFTRNIYNKSPVTRNAKNEIIYLSVRDSRKKFIKQPYQILCVNLLIITIITIYLLFIRIPHCCDLEKKNLGIWGGFFNKIITIIKVVHDTKGNLREIKLSNYSYLNK